MTGRQVTHSGKDCDGDITALCNPGMSWSPCSKRDDIDARRHPSYVLWQGVHRTRNRVVNGQTGKHLRTDLDSMTRNNLDDLLDCWRSGHVRRKPINMPTSYDRIARVARKKGTTCNKARARM